ncbi:granzyme B(G,H)-like [Sander lucioperca]|uniref:granzyme B(G,H)-like n=1 Tax=Sander lucioperca TaxID=283035 RepID=UPI00165352D8|nr:granzyme B(G,H)-like [Sander lucioperca]
MVLLERHMQDGKTKYCGGFLLNEDFVMTAAHCKASSYTVLLGVHNISNSNGVQRISVEQTFPHEDYNETDFNNDIMLLKLSSKAKFRANVRPIALAGQDVGSLPKSCIVSGWGKTNKTISYMSVLMEVNVTLIDSKQCPTNNMYCSKGETGLNKVRIFVTKWTNKFVEAITAYCVCTSREILVFHSSVKMERCTGWGPTSSSQTQVARKLTVLPKFLTTEAGLIQPSKMH